MKSIGISLILLSFGYLASCASESGKGDSETHWLTCNTDQDCSGSDVCAAERCVAPDASVRAGSGGSVATGGASSAGRAGGGGGSQSRDGGVPPPDSSLADEADASDGASRGGSNDDASAFRVVSVSPIDGVSDAGATASIAATFSGNVLASSVTSAFDVRGPRDPLVGTVTASDDTATFTPGAPLPLACTETATLGASVADLDGHALGAPYKWSFTTADGSWRGEQAVGGAGYADTGLFGEPQRRVFVAADGSAFTAWAAYDSTATHVYANASRYTPSGGWTPYLQFDEYEKKGMYGGSTPAVAVSDNGEAMVLWRNGSGADGGISYVLMAMRYASGWEAPVRIEGPSGPTGSAPINYTLGADAKGDFVAAWIEQPGVVRMAHYTRGSGWGPTEIPPPTGPDAGEVPETFGVNLSTDAEGDALVVWSEGIGGQYSVAAERYDHSTGWSAKEVLVEHVTGQFGVSSPYGAIGNDGSAVATWVQIDPSLQASHSIVRSLVAGSWSPGVILDAPTGAGSYNQPQVATDGNGTYIVVWTEADAVGDQAYASRLTPGGSWSPKVLLNTPLPPAGGATANLQELYPSLAMGASGDAVVRMTLWDHTSSASALDVVTFSPAQGWTAPTRLDSSAPQAAPPVMDACGNATLVWTNLPTNGVMTSRRIHGGSWTTPTHLGAVPNSSDYSVAAGLGANGETIASWRSQDGHGISADVLR